MNQEFYYPILGKPTPAENLLISQAISRALDSNRRGYFRIIHREVQHWLDHIGLFSNNPLITYRYPNGAVDFCIPDPKQTDKNAHYYEHANVKTPSDEHLAIARLRLEQYFRDCVDHSNEASREMDLDSLAKRLTIQHQYRDGGFSFAVKSVVDESRAYYFHHFPKLT